MGTLGSVYTVSYFNNQPAVATNVQDTFQSLDVKSQPFCECTTRIHAYHVHISSRPSWSADQGMHLLLATRPSLVGISFAYRCGSCYRLTGQRYFGAHACFSACMPRHAMHAGD